MYFVFMCPKCGSFRYAREGQKTALCFKCDYRITVDPTRIRILAKTDRSEEAKILVQKYKMERGKKR